MKILVFLHDEGSNFGDDLNRWVWSRLLGFSLDVDDGALLLGIGTVIAQSLVPPAKRYIVLGSGVGYEAWPLDFGEPNWEILAVRGPLTALLLNLPPERGVIDGAALLRLLPECEPLPSSQREGIVFMPHYETLRLGNWRQACELAGFEFLDPLADSEQTVQRIRRARLVIADAMHAAIVADALRVPWIPIVLSPQTNAFKWLDWTMSLNLPYCPTKLPASTLLESAWRFSLWFRGGKFFLENRTPSRAIKQYKRLMRLNSWTYWPFWRRRIGIVYAIPRRIISSSALRSFKEREDEKRTIRAADELRRVAAMPSYLSDENVFMSKLEQMASLLQKVKSYLSNAEPTRDSDMAPAGSMSEQQTNKGQCAK